MSVILRNSPIKRSVTLTYFWNILCIYNLSLQFYYVVVD